jgi:threonine/homoserine/homoserine lactone efflux protein
MMVDPFAFLFSVLVMLGTPGPTNTLLAASGATGGWRAALKLVPAELAGYLVSILLLMTLLGPAVAANPAVAAVLKLAAGGWLALAAVRLWREAGRDFAGTPSPIGACRVFVTTLLNPKALVFALVIFPPAPPSAVLTATAAFSLMVVAVACCWITFGVLIARGASRRLTPRRVSRIAAVVLGVFASLIAGSAVAGAV